ncbi:NAD(P)/FAD-dependent oxidoreductase [Cohnella hongkongensis]|uniref:NAD(P)/FAD-dependent oxidoreductase n=1 Tax=Cohnella hongkongensis TaxID=178337 RepID=A0ABV9F798_9BACL
MRTDFDVVVVGAGIAGSAVAHALARRGREVALFDRSRFPRHKACGEFLSPEALGTLRALGLDRTIAALRPAEITTVRLHADSGGVSLEIPLPGPALGLSRRALDAALQQAAHNEGASVYTGTTVAEVAEAEGGRLVALSAKDGGARLRARAVIAAWGRHPLTSPSAPGRTADAGKAYVGMKSHYATVDSDAAVDLYFFRDGYVGLAPIEDGRLNVAAIVTLSACRRYGPADALGSILDRAAERIPALGRRLQRAVPVPGTQAAAAPVPIRSRPIPWNGIPGVGDALAAIPPFCGDGMSMALRSAELCAPLADAYLRGDCTYRQWEKIYSQHIRRQFAGALRWGGWLERLLTRPALAAWLLRAGALLPGAAEQLVRATRWRN